MVKNNNWPYGQERPKAVDQEINDYFPNDSNLYNRKLQQNKPKRPVSAANKNYDQKHQKITKEEEMQPKLKKTISSSKFKD